MYYIIISHKQENNMNFEHERYLESLSTGDVMVTTIHSNGWGGIRIELAEEEVMNRFGSRKLVKYMSTVLSEEDALRLRDSLLEQFPINLGEYQ